MLTIPRFTRLAALAAFLVFQSCYSLSPVSSAYYPVTTNRSLTDPHSGLVRNDIPIRSMRQLLKWYPEAADINWENSSKGLNAIFEEENANTSLDFDKYGDCARAFTRYSTAPSDIRKMVGRRYPDYEISSVYSVTTYGEHIRIDYNIVVTNAELSRVLTWNNVDFQLQELASN